MVEQNQIQNMFFSKDIITNLNKIVQQQTNSINSTKEEKQELVNTLVKNMKTVYKNIDTSKINNKNFESIFDQYKKHSIMETINDIKKSKASSTDMKFKRDFTSNPNQGNRVMDRPTSTKSSFEGFSNSNGYESSLDQVFKPIVDNLNDNKFNNFNSGKPKDAVSRMEDVQKSRQAEMAARNQRPPTPDFLKSQKSNPDKDSSNSRNSSFKPVGRGDKPDFTNMKSDEMNQGFQGLSNDTGGDLYSLDNFDKQLIDVDMTEDTTSFEDRLKKLQSERGNIKPITNNTAVDFTSDTFPKSDSMGNNMIPQKTKQMLQQEQLKQQQFKQDQLKQQSIQEQQRQEQQRQEQSIQEQQRQEQQYKQQSIQEQQRQEQQYKQQSIQEQQRQEQFKQQQQMPQDQVNDKFSMIKNSMKSVNIEVKEETKRLKQLEEENNMLKETIRQYNELDTIKQQIADEFEQLNNKNEIVSLKEIELAKKESEIKQLIVNYDYLFKSHQLQFEVTSKENKSNYVWNMKMIPNVMGIKLMSYSIPLPRFNVEENKNNMLKIKIGDTIHDINVKNGKYTIDELIDSINNVITKMKININVTVNSMQHITIESENDFELIETILSKDNLGFTNKYDISNKIISDRIWDLRVEDKVYLYLNNLSDIMPFGVLHFNGNSTCNFRFDKPFNMEKLEIIFKDSKGYDFNFHNLPHSLSFMVDLLN